MSHDEIDRILRADDTLAPSSGFAASVMEAVRREAEGPEPLQFPWRRAAPGIVVCLLGIVVAAIASVSGAAGYGTDWSIVPEGLERVLLAQSTLWLAGSLLGSWLAVRLSLRLAGFER